MIAKTNSVLAAVILLGAISRYASAADVPVEAPPSAAPAPVFFVNNNSIGYAYAFNATNPGAGETPKNDVNFTHFDVWAYGTNFFTIDWLQATNAKAPTLGTPAAPCDQNGPLDPPGSQRCPGYTEIYGLFRSTFGWNQIFNTKAFAIGPLTNIEFALGADANTDNTTLGSAKRSIQTGLQADFLAPYKGFLNVGVFVYKEWQHDGFASTFPFEPIPNPSGKVEFSATWAVEINYMQPLGFLPSNIPLTYKALVSMHGDKGCGETCAPLGPGLLHTEEYLTQQSLNLDVGQLFWDKPNRLSVWVGFRWWKNKFGIQPNQPNGDAVDNPNEAKTKVFPFTTENSWLIGTTLIF